MVCYRWRQSKQGFVVIASATDPTARGLDGFHWWHRRDPLPRNSCSLASCDLPPPSRQE